MSRIFACMTFLFALSTALCAAQGSRTLPDSVLPAVFSAMGHSPQWVYQHYGRPARVRRSSCCAFQGYRSSDYPNTIDVLLHAYDLESGGRVAYIYDQPLHSDSWQVVGIAYDALSSTEYQRLRSFFPSGAPRGQRIFGCYEDDFFHHPEDQISERALFLLWNAGPGREIYARYLTGAHIPTRYDPVTGRGLPTLVRNPDNYPLVQFAYFRAPAHIMDMHMAVDDDFSITSLNKDCVK